MTPNYLTDYLHLSLSQMGLVMSAIGLGGFAGDMVMPALSDRFGRKPVVLFSFVATAVFLWMLINTGAALFQLFALLFLTTFFNFSMICMICMINGPLTSEAVPASLLATATGLVVGIGELFGGGIAPALAGFIAQNYGIEKTLLLTLSALGVGLLIALLLKETAPAKRKVHSGEQLTNNDSVLIDSKPE